MIEDRQQSVSAGPPPTADPQDPLPESRFLFRRIFSYGLVLLLLLATAGHGWLIGEAALAGNQTAIAGLINLAWWDRVLIGLITTYYLLAPSAEQITRIVQVTGAAKAGVLFRNAAAAEGPGGAASASAAIEPPAAVQEALAPARPTYDGPDPSDIPAPDARVPEQPRWS